MSDIDVILPSMVIVALPPDILPIEIVLPSMVMVILSYANAAGDVIPTTNETPAMIPTIVIKFNLYMQM